MDLETPPIEELQERIDAAHEAVDLRFWRDFWSTFLEPSDSAGADPK